MKVIIAGPRDFNDYDVVCKAVEASEFEITEVVSGKAKGVDTLGERWASDNNVPVQPFPAEWNNLKQPGAVVATNSWDKKYNKNAGFYRNGLMAEYADALIAIDTGSGGTGDMIRKATEAGLQVFRYDPEEHMTDDEFGHIF